MPPLNAFDSVMLPPTLLVEIWVQQSAGTGFPDDSDGKESDYNAEDPGLIPE